MSNIERGPIVVKFGGTSVKDGDRFIKSGDIVRENPERTHVVLSAPAGITRLLKECHDLHVHERSFDRGFGLIEERFTEIAGKIQFQTVDDLLQELREQIYGGDRDLTLSRGEYLNAMMMAHHLDYEFVDAADVMVKDGERFRITKKLPEKMVMGGYYASLDGKSDHIVTLGDNTSDVSGAILADEVNASSYEVWIDPQLGVCAAHPDYIKNPKVIENMTHQEIRELAYTGAEVLHPDAVPYLDDDVRDVHIPIHIRNSSNLKAKGTLITETRELSKKEAVIGIAGMKGFVSLEIESTGMSDRYGVVSPIYGILAEEKISVTEPAGSLDHESIIIHKDELKGKEESLLVRIRDEIKNVKVEVNHDELALICVVGEGIKDHSSAVKAKLFKKLARKGINDAITVQSRSGCNIMFWVPTEKFLRSIKIAHKTFI